MMEALALPTALWLAIVIAGLALRPLLPIDETRYMSVAWGMFSGGHFLVPHLNGAPYSDKPPVLFWSIDAMWAVTGVSEWVGRLVAPLYGLGCIAMVARIAQRLWPDDAASMRSAAQVFAGTGAFAVYGSLTMFDLPLTFFVLVAIEAVLAARGGGWWPWVVCGAAMGLGILTKGPVTLLHVLSVALLAPLWMTGRAPRGWGRWYAGSGVALLCCAAVGLAWAVPAAIAGGEAYGHALFWGQTADRMVKSFAHRRPVWWYLPLVPALAFPWAVFPAAWRAAFRTAWRGDAGLRLCIVWLVAPFIVFSLVSGKQPHYLVPEISRARPAGGAAAERGPRPGAALGCLGSRRNRGGRRARGPCRRDRHGCASGQGGRMERQGQPCHRRRASRRRAGGRGGRRGMAAPDGRRPRRLHGFALRAGKRAGGTDARPVLRSAARRDLHRARRGAGPAAGACHRL